MVKYQQKLILNIGFNQQGKPERVQVLDLLARAFAAVDHNFDPIRYFGDDPDYTWLTADVVPLSPSPPPPKTLKEQEEALDKQIESKKEDKKE